MRLIDADALEKTLGEWIRNYWTEAFTGSDAGSEFADMIEHAETIDATTRAIQGRKDRRMSDTISRQAAIDAIDRLDIPEDMCVFEILSHIELEIGNLPSAQSEPPEKYEYHYDHTDCIWYRPEARNRCPSTCAQYRDGWNDAMNYIYRDGKGYRPYRRGEQYGE